MFDKAKYNQITFDGTISTGLTLVALVGSFVLTGTSTIFLRTYNFIVSTGSFTLTGISAGFLKGLYLIASLGIFTLTGFQVILKKTLHLITSVGVFTLTGTITIFSYVLDNIKPTVLIKRVKNYIMISKERKPTLLIKVDSKPKASIK